MLLFMMKKVKLAEEMVEVGRRLYQSGFVAANDGNISVRVNEKHVLITPSGVSKGFMSASSMLLVNLEGEVIEGEGRPSTESAMHFDIYKHRPDVQAVVHAHPPTATGFAVAGIPLDQLAMPELIVTMGTIPLAPYGMPGTDELPSTLRPYYQEHDAILLSNHGAVTMGRTLTEALFKMESVEMCAKILFTARMLGRVRELSDEQVDKLVDSRSFYGLKGAHPGKKIIEQRRKKGEQS
ncbi:L-fuculose-phosphate aldolase [Aneurinibacillus thermoaerophilus]|jgi:L-fuculose-phosphate aldolase|uniref:L-fuculose-phosphate aldolase n=2 Tax=Aneurinibacillus thermoaerophilus TaxID=143495 RepID=A0A1G7YNA0_ANETH|nr:L-fuculose-phosphate aldolase [Aneurinibacillus thermoaerophilus]